MRKISKQNQDPKQVEKDATALAQLAGKVSQHFAVGTYIVMDNKRAEILDAYQISTGNYLYVLFEDGSVSLIKPMALNR